MDRGLVLWLPVIMRIICGKWELNEFSHCNYKFLLVCAAEEEHRPLGQFMFPVGLKLSLY